MERVALYCRVSTEEQSRHGLSLAEQEHSLEEYAKAHNMKVVGKYIDAGISARKKYTKRPELLRLLEDVKSGQIDTILFIKLDRWFRDVSGYYDVQKILDQYHVSWRATQEDYETVTASGRFKVNIMLSVAQDEADRTSERIKFVLKGKRERNEVISGKIPLGYKIENKHLVKDDTTAPLIRKMFDLYLETGSPAKVIKAMPELHLSYQSLQRLLRMESYAGNHHGVEIEPIITPEEYQKIQSMQKHIVRKNQTNRIYLFSGMIQCPECGYRMNGMPPSAEKPGEYNYYYACGNHRKRAGCQMKTQYPEKKIEQYLLDNIEQRYDTICNLKSGQKVESHESERKAILKKLSKLSELYINDLIEIKDYKRQFEQLQTELSAIPPDTKSKDYSNLRQIFVDDWRKMYGELSRESKQLFWRNALESIIVKDKEVVDFIFNAGH